MSADSASVLVWREELGALEARLGELFVRAEPRRQAGLYLEGLLSAAKRKNGWQLAEQIGDARPWRTQRVLSHVLWDQDAARDLCRDYVIEHLGAADGVLIVDETGFLKKGEHSVGVARQYSGTAGRIDNCQIGVFLAYASRFGQALIDRRLYLPEAWANNEARRTKAGVPQEATFATKPQIACELIASALEPSSALLARGGAGGDRPRDNGRCPGERGLGDPCRRRGLKGTAALRVGAHPAVLTRGSQLRALAPDPSQPARAQQTSLLLCVRSGGPLAGRTSGRGGAALDHRGVL